MKKGAIITLIVTGAITFSMLASLAVKGAFLFYEKQATRHRKEYQEYLDDWRDRAYETIDNSRNNPFFDDISE